MKNLIIAAFIALFYAFNANSFEAGLYELKSFEDGVTMSMNTKLIPDLYTKSAMTKWYGEHVGGQVLALFQVVPSILTGYNFGFHLKGGVEHFCFIDPFSEYFEEDAFQCFQIKKKEEGVWSAYINMGGRQVHAGDLFYKGKSELGESELGESEQGELK